MNWRLLRVKLEMLMIPSSIYKILALFRTLQHQINEKELQKSIEKGHKKHQLSEIKAKLVEFREQDSLNDLVREHSRQE
jgi:hypothetical protein